MIDLHTHTTASDGLHAPAELVKLASAAGLRALAVTDHDTLAGIAEARAAARPLGLRLITGIELSAFVHGKEAHILGHFVRPGLGELSSLSAMLRREREKRMRAMLVKLEKLKMPVSFDEVLAASGGENLGRPHLGRVMVAKGYARSFQEAFDVWLATGKAAFVERYKLTSEDAIKLIREAGGAATLAHAKVSKMTREDVEALKAQGLAGLEVAHSDHDAAARREVGRWARELDLVPTAGSDFHGADLSPGRVLGDRSMEESELARLQERAALPPESDDA